MELPYMEYDKNFQLAFLGSCTKKFFKIFIVVLTHPDLLILR